MKVFLTTILFILGLLLFISELFILEIDGTIGFLLTYISISIMIYSIVKLCKLSPKIKNFLKAIINELFNIW